MKASEAKQLGEELLREPVKRINNVSKLLKAVCIQNEEALQKSAIQFLKMFFLASFERGSLSCTSSPAPVQGHVSTTSAQDTLHAWLRQKYDSFCQKLHTLMQEPDAGVLQVIAMNTIMELVRGQQVGVFDQILFSRAIMVLLQSSTIGQEVLQLVMTKYMVYADVRLYTLQAIHRRTEGSHTASLSEVLTGRQAGRRLFEVLAGISPMLSSGDQDDAVQSWCGAIEAGIVTAAPLKGEGVQQRRKRKRESAASESAPLLGAVQWASAPAYKRAFSEAWLGLLRLPLPSDLLKKVLVQLHSSVIPNIPNPLLLSDFLSSCLDEGGLVGMLALNGIFTLVTRHGLEYPHFYARLYALLQAPVFRAKYRARFLQLADIFLSSGMVPAYTAAAFIKKFARLALTAPPAGAIIAIAFIHNLLRRHPSCSVLLNKPLAVQSAVAKAAAPLQLTDSRVEAATPAAASMAAVTQNGLPHTMTNGHSKGTHNDESSDASKSQASDDDSSDAEVPDGAADNAAYGVSLQIQEASTGGEVGVGQDIFDEHEPNPAKCRAIESSLWELESLRQHYYHSVATYVSILDKDLGDRKRTAEVDVSALLRSSYSEFIVLESGKRLKSVPVAFYSAPPSQLFASASKVDFSGWTF